MELDTFANSAARSPTAVVSRYTVVVSDSERSVPRLYTSARLSLQPPRMVCVPQQRLKRCEVGTEVDAAIAAS